MSRKPNLHYSAAFRRDALERMRTALNIRALARELGLSPTTLYSWRKNAALQVKAQSAAAGAELSNLRNLEATLIMLEREAAYHSLANGNMKLEGSLPKAPPGPPGPESGSPSLKKAGGKRRRKRD